MTLIDRYLIVLFARVFLVCFLTLSGLLVIAQIFTNLDELIEYGRRRGSLPLALAEYFGPVLLTICPLYPSAAAQQKRGVGLGRARVI